MRKKNGDTPATGYDGPDHNEPGLTKREAFAMAAMQGLLAADMESGWGANEAALQAVIQADALLAALEESQ